MVSGAVPYTCPVSSQNPTDVPSPCCLPGPLVHHPLRALKLPLPRVELQPFPPNWPRPTRPLPPLLLQPALQRYFVPEDTNPNRYT